MRLTVERATLIIGMERRHVKCLQMLRDRHLEAYKNVDVSIIKQFVAHDDGNVTHIQLNINTKLNIPNSTEY